MTPTPKETSWVTDEETDESSIDVENEAAEEQTRTQVRVAWQDRLRRGVRYIRRMRPRGNAMPAVGTHCIVIVGDAKQDLGQMAQVSSRKSKMVEIKYRGKQDRRMDYKMKRPSSLIMLEEGLVLQQDVDGTVWIRREDDR
jgi:hypothetical protein